MTEKPPDSEPTSYRREWAKAMNLSVIGMVFPVSLVLGYLAGRWIGGLFEAVSVGGMIGALVGLVAGFYNMIKMVSGMGSKAPADGTDGAGGEARD